MKTGSPLTMCNLDFDAQGNMMKIFESQETGRTFIPFLPVYARLDGRAFHKFTRNSVKPFDVNLHENMINVAKVLMAETNATLAYTQSDEISIAWATGSDMFSGKKHKFTSILSGLASSKLMELSLDGPTEMRVAARNSPPHFDCRALNLPNLEQLFMMFMWRERDATKNAISMAASAYFSSKQLHKLSGNEKQELLFREKQINFNDYPSWAKRGTFIKQREVTKYLTNEELAEEKRKNPKFKLKGNTYTRNVIDTFIPSALLHNMTLEAAVKELFQ